MSRSEIALADKLKLLFKNVTHADGSKFTYDYIRSLTDIDPSTISRIRSGQNQDPTFSNIAKLARAFGVSLDYFAIKMTVEEALTYIQHHRDVGAHKSYFDGLKSEALQRSAARVESLALRASHLDSEALEAVEMMVNYVLKQKGMPVPDISATNEEVAQKSNQGKVDVAVPDLRNV